MSKRHALAGAVALLATACGGGSRPTAPGAPSPQPTPQVLTIISGETGAPVSGAHVNAGGQLQTSDAAGRVTVSGGMPGSTLVDVVGEGYFDRQTQLSRAEGGAPYALWPRTSDTGLDERATGQIVYTLAGVGVVDPPYAEAELVRWAPGQPPVDVVLQGPATDAYYREFSPDGVAVQAEAVAAINAALAGRLTLRPPVLRDGAPAPGSIVVRILPEYSRCVRYGVAALASIVGPVIRNVTITLCDPRYTSSVAIATHELGHAVGLRHSIDSRDVMCSCGRLQASAPSAREQLLLRLMYQRPAGNRFPDNDRSASTARQKTVEIRCP